MFIPERALRTVILTALAALILAGADSVPIAAQPATAAEIGVQREASATALPLAEDRGAAGLEQSLRRLRTTASVMVIVAHPDDEDGALLTYLARGLGARVTLLTLTRGEGGQNAMSAESNDALGLLRTNELLRAGEFYGVKQLWGTEADFGFSKTQEEAFARWGHERVLYDAVLAVRRERPQVIVSTFVGGVSDGHGHHQVSGEIAQEVFKAAADPKVFPEQLKDGLQTWQPLAVYSMVPFAPIKDGKIFDYATGKWAAARFKNYVTGAWSEGALSSDVTIPVGERDSVLGRSYAQIAREGWGEQKSQNGGANPALSGAATTSYHLWAAARDGEIAQGETNDSLFHNRKVEIDTSLAGLAKDGAPEWVAQGLREIDAGLAKFAAGRQGKTNAAQAHQLAAIYRQTLEVRERIATSVVRAGNRASLLLELDTKIEQFQDALKELLGLDLMAFTTKSENTPGKLQRGASADETPPSVTPGEEFRVRIHTAQSNSESRLEEVWLVGADGQVWQKQDAGSVGNDETLSVKTPENASPTQPYFTRPSVEQPYYDISRLEWRLRSFAPYPLTAWAEFKFDGLPIRVGQVVQTMQHVAGLGGLYEPLVVTPAVGVRMEPEERILPLDGSALPVRVTVHTERAAEGTVKLELPTGWRAEPAEAKFHRDGAGDTEAILFSVTPQGAEVGAYKIQAVAQADGREFRTGWRSVGYAGMRPYNQYKATELRTRKVNAKLAGGLRIGYVMGTGDLVPEAIEGMGEAVHSLTATELTTSDLSAWNTIVIGIRAYSVRPELARAEERLVEFVRGGGTLVVEYQSGDFPAPLALTLGHEPEKVVDEQAPVKLLATNDRLLNWPNRITVADFEDWVEERGHSFAESWDAGYTALTETADAGQEAQRGGLLEAHIGKGSYIYVAYALHRQLPELVPGAYRLLANLLSAGR